MLDIAKVLETACVLETANVLETAKVLAGTGGTPARDHFEKARGAWPATYNNHVFNGEPLPCDMPQHACDRRREPKTLYFAISSTFAVSSTCCNQCNTRLMLQLGMARYCVTFPGHFPTGA